MNIQLPVVHINGSGRKSLQEQYYAAYMGVHGAIVALRKLEIHDRDYYLLGSNAGPRARHENQARLDRLKEILDEIEAIYKSLDSDS